MVADQETKTVDVVTFSPSLRLWVQLSAVALSLLSAVAVQATDRYFFDISVKSSNGRYMVEAKSPDNAGERWKISFQSRFTYRLIDQLENRELWTRQQPMAGNQRYDIGEGPPVTVYVNDQGWVVIRTADVWQQPIELIVLGPEGEEKVRVDVMGALFPALRDRDLQRYRDSFLRYTGESTAGIRWGPSYCHFYFISIKNSPYFCMRTWWGKRLLLDLTGGRQVQIGPEFQHELFSAEKQFVLKVLKGTRDWKWATGRGERLVLSEDSRQPTLVEGLRAIHMAGTMKFVEAAPLLQKLESCLYVGSSSGGSGPYQAASGGIKPYSYKSLTIRQLSQLSLRRLGMRPSGHQATMLNRVDDGFWHPNDPLSFRRETRTSEISVGLKPEEVLEAIGAPDFIVKRAWEYDIDDASPYTFIISWGPEGVEKITRHTPPKWSDDFTRDREFTD
jgi:hypothetical protein